MNYARRSLAVLLCLLLTFGSFGSVFADDMPTVIEENIASEPEHEAAPESGSEAVTNSDDEVLPSPDNEIWTEPEDEPLTEPSTEPSASEDDSEHTGESSAEPDMEEDGDAPTYASDIDYTRSAAHSPKFVLGYAELIGESIAYASPSPSADTIYRVNGGVFYVLNRSNTSQADRLEAAFDGGDCELIVWIDSDRLRPMSPEETLAFVQARAAAEGVRYLYNAIELPLDAPSYTAAFTLDLTEEDARAIPASPAMLVAQTAFTLGVGEELKIPVSFTDSEEHRVSYTSDDPEIAEASDDGVVVPKKVGDTNIRLESEFGSSASIHITVQNAPTKVSLTAPRKTLGVNEQIQLEAAADPASKLLYTSSDPTVASADGSGNLTTYKAGTVVITASTYNNKSASVTLTVKDAPNGIDLSDSELTLGVGQTAKLTARLDSSCAGSYEFTSDKPEILTVDPVTGVLEAMGVGDAIVTVETYNHEMATCAVTVNAQPDSVAFAQESISIGLRETTKVPDILLNGEKADAEDGSYAAGCTFATSNKNIVAVNAATGVIRGVKRGRLHHRHHPQRQDRQG